MAESKNRPGQRRHLDGPETQRHEVKSALSRLPEVVGATGGEAVKGSTRRKRIRLLMPLGLASLLAFSGGCLGPRKPPRQPPLPAKPHYKSYTIDGHDPIAEAVVIKNQFGDWKVDIGRATHLLAPARKNKEGDLRAPHLKCYVIETNTVAGVNVDLQTQFGDERNVRVVRAARLCIPAHKTLSTDAPELPEPTPLPDYRCFVIDGKPPKKSVNLKTQFGEEENVNIGRATRLCAPAIKSHGRANGSFEKNKEHLAELEDRFPHLKCYDIVGDDPDTHVNLRSQFGLEEGVEIEDAKRLCVPAIKAKAGRKPEGNLPKGPHYKCYRIRGQNVRKEVTVEDQFGRESNVDVFAGQQLCVPALKNGEGDLNAPHLECFHIDDQRPDKKVNLRTQFGEELGVEVKTATDLCVPVQKRVIPVAKEPHYTCYNLPNGHDPPVRADIETQFTREPQTEIQAARGLCLPSLKNPRGTEQEKKEALKDLQERFPHLKCYVIDGHLPDAIVNLTTQFSHEHDVRVEKSEDICVPVAKRRVRPQQVYHSPDFQLQLVLQTELGVDTATLNGQQIMIVDAEGVEDLDADGLEEALADIAVMDARGSTQLHGPIMFRLRESGAFGPIPDRPSLGRIEEKVNNTPGVLDAPPFAQAGVANSFLDLYFELELPRLGLRIHNNAPSRGEAEVMTIPPAGETHCHPDVQELKLFDDKNQPTNAVQIIELCYSKKR